MTLNFLIAAVFFFLSLLPFFLVNIFLRLHKKQIEAMIRAAKEDKMGTYATGAMDRLLAGSRESLALIKDASDK